VTQSAGHSDKLRYDLRAMAHIL